MPTPESYVKKKVSALLKAVSKLWYTMPVPSGFGQPNLDYNAVAPCKDCGRGLFIAVETKRPGAKPTAQQEATIARLRAAGAAVFVIDGDTQELEIWLLQNVRHDQP
jgi:hypothetical protein